MERHGEVGDGYRESTKLAVHVSVLSVDLSALVRLAKGAENSQLLSDSSGSLFWSCILEPYDIDKFRNTTDIVLGIFL